MMTHSIISFHIVSVWKNIDFVYEKWQMMLKLNAYPLGPAINMPICRAQRTVSQGFPQPAYDRAWPRYSRLLSRGQVFTSAEIPLDSC
jgi:hypothetical protein